MGWDGDQPHGLNFLTSLYTPCVSAYLSNTKSILEYFIFRSPVLTLNILNHIKVKITKEKTFITIPDFLYKRFAVVQHVQYAV